MLYRIKNEPLLKTKTATIYVQNLNEKVKISDLKNHLFQEFSNIGVDVREVMAKKNIRMRGQAFVVCGDEDQAEQAIKQMRGRIFFDKPLRLNFAKQNSDMITKARGTFDESIKLKRDQVRKIDIKNKEIKKKKKMIDRYFQLKESLRM